LTAGQKQEVLAALEFLASARGVISKNTVNFSEKYIIRPMS